MNMLKKTYDIFTEDHVAYLGFIANLGLIVLAYILTWAIAGFLNIQESQIKSLHIFFGSYLILFFIHYKAIIGKNSKFNSGFILSVIIVIILIIIKYILFLA